MIGRYLNLECAEEWKYEESPKETNPVADYDRSKAVRESGKFQLFV